MSKHYRDTVPHIASSEITPESVWLGRRGLIKAAVAGTGMVVVGESVAQPKVLKDFH